MTKVVRERLLIGAAVVLLVLGLGAAAGAHAVAGSVLRWLAVLLLAAFAEGRRGLTPWIFVAMIAGAELGVDAPHFAVELHVLSDIFLRLIKTIVAPLFWQH